MEKSFFYKEQQAYDQRHTSSSYSSFFCLHLFGSMEWWDRVSSSMRSIWLCINKHLVYRRRKTAGLGKLRREVRTCEYEDVHIMWDMLRKSDSLTPSHQMESCIARFFQRPTPEMQFSHLDF